MKVFAHRGFSGRYPENTMLAFEKAVECNADGIELDVHLSKDGEVMIMHDEALKRTTGRPGIVSDYTRAELERIGVGKNEEGEWNEQPTIPSLEEYLEKIGSKVITNIELKTAPLYYPGIEEKTAALIRRYGLEEKIIISSFNWLSVLRMQKIAPELKYALLFSGIELENMGLLFSDMGIDYYHPDEKLLSQSLIQDMKVCGIGINAWTVNDEKRVMECLSMGCDGVITNFPDMARRTADDSEKR